MGLFCVYRHTAPNGKSYIGITSKKPEHRWNHGRAYFQNKHFTHAINLYGWDNFTHEILFVNLSKEEACEKEKELIALYRTNDPTMGYNLSSGGENPAEGVKQSRESIERRRRANTGQKRSDYTKELISSRKKGRSNGLEGRIGNMCSKAGIVSQINEDTNEVIATFYGYDEMHRRTGFAKTPVKEAVAGKRKRAYGFIWEYQKRGLENVSV